MRQLWVKSLAVCTCILILAFAGLGRTVEKLPPLQPHPLPPTLAQWQDSSNSGDYFAEIKSTPAGYLVWWEFPVKVFVEPEENSALVSENAQKAKDWVSAVLEAIKEWNVYLPLELVKDSTIADIVIWRKAPAWKPTFDRNTGRFELPRARTAETRFEFYRRKTANGQTVLSHKFTIQVNPNQVPNYILPSIRHELGHALGIWGHSPVETDALYFSQVRNSPPISQGDINTLKKIYQQPTLLGWPLSEGN